MSTLEPTSIDMAAPRIAHVRRNYSAHLLDGGLFIGAMALLDATTILPKMIESLGGSTWLIAAMPIVMMLGFLLPPIFTAHRIERMQRYKPLLMMTGVLQRLPFLLAALALFYLAPTNPKLAIAAVAVAPLISGMVGGSTLVAWQQLLVKTIPSHRRSSMFAARNIMAASLGFVAAKVIKEVIEKHPGAEGYGYLHLLTFAGLILSYLCFAVVRETGEHVPPPEEHHSLSENLRLIPGIVRKDHNLGFFILSNIFSHGIFVTLPFMTIHILDLLGKQESYMGNLLVYQMTGMVCGNITSGFLGDRSGNRSLLYIGRIMMGLGIAGLLIAGTEWAIAAGYFVLWFGFSANHVGRQSYGLEICPKQKQATYLAIMAMAGFPAVVFFSMFSALLKKFDASFTTLGLVTITCLIIAVLLLRPLEEPRKWNYVKES